MQNKNNNPLLKKYDRAQSQKKVMRIGAWIAGGLAALALIIGLIFLLIPKTPSDTEIAKGILDWLWDNRDDRGLNNSLGECTENSQGITCQFDPNPPSLRHTAVVIWARYNYWLKTGDQEELDRLTSNINDYYNVSQDPQWLIQPDNYHFYYLSQLYLSDKPEINSELKEKLMAIITNSNPEDGLWIEADGTFLGLDETQLMTIIEDKLYNINTGNLAYQGQPNDRFFSTTEFDLNNFNIQVIEVDSAIKMSLPNYNQTIMLATFDGAITHFLKNSLIYNLQDYAQLLAAAKVFNNYYQSPQLETFISNLTENIQRNSDYSTLIDEQKLDTLTTLALSQYIAANNTSTGDSQSLNAIKNLFLNTYQQFATPEMLLIKTPLPTSPSIIENSIFASLLMIES